MVYSSESLAKGIPIKLTSIPDVESLEEIMYSFFALSAGLMILWTIGLSYSSPDVRRVDVLDLNRVGSRPI
jgi:hypothetical protein